MRECNPHLKPKVEVTPRGLSHLFGVSHQSTKGRKNNIIGLKDPYGGFATHFPQKGNAEVRRNLNMNGGLYLLLWGIPVCALGGSA